MVQQELRAFATWGFYPWALVMGCDWELGGCSMAPLPTSILDPRILKCYIYGGNSCHGRFWALQWSESVQPIRAGNKGKNVWSISHCSLHFKVPMLIIELFNYSYHQEYWPSTSCQVSWRKLAPFSDRLLKILRMVFLGLILITIYSILYDISIPFQFQLEHICQTLANLFQEKTYYRLGHFPPLAKLRLQLALWLRRRRRLQSSMARPSQRVLCNRSGGTSKMQLGRKHQKCKDYVPGM